MPFENELYFTSMEFPIKPVKFEYLGLDKVSENGRNSIESLKVPIVVYFDFETFLEPMDAEEKALDSEISYTVKIHKHVSYSLPITLAHFSKVSGGRFHIKFS